MAISFPVRAELRLLGAILAFFVLLFAFEAPAAAHFGATHLDMPGRTAPIAAKGVVDDRSADTPHAADAACNDDCGCCTSDMMHGHCHPPAMLAARGESGRRFDTRPSAWARPFGVGAADLSGAPPVPPPNAG
jgi:hypothetical protein